MFNKSILRIAFKVVALATFRRWPTGSLSLLFVYAITLRTLTVTSLYSEEIPQVNFEPFISTIRDVFPVSGEIVVEQIDFTPPGDPNAPISSVQNKPKKQQFHAVWQGSNFFIKEFEGTATNKLEFVSGQLVGRRGLVGWHAVGKQVTYTSPPSNEGKLDSEANNSCSFFVQNGESIMRSFVLGGFDWKDAKWIGNHFSATVDGVRFEAGLFTNNNQLQLIGHSQDGELGVGFKIDYLNFLAEEDKVFPREYNVYLRMPQAKDYVQKYSRKVIKIKAMNETNSNEAFFPTYHLNTNEFQFYAHAGNQVVSLMSSRPIPVKQQQPLPPASRSRRYILISIFAIISLACLLMLGRTKNKTKNEKP